MGDSTESAWWIGGGSHPFAFSLTYEIHVNIGISGHSRYKSVVPEGHITWEILLGFLALDKAGLLPETAILPTCPTGPCRYT